MTLLCRTESLFSHQVLFLRNKLSYKTSFNASALHMPRKSRLIFFQLKLCWKGPSDSSCTATNWSTVLLNQKPGENQRYFNIFVQSKAYPLASNYLKQAYGPQATHWVTQPKGDHCRAKTTTVSVSNNVLVVAIY